MQIKALIFIFLISICCAQVQVQSLGKSGLENALLMERKGDLQEAQKIYELILETKPKNRQAYNRLKNIYKRLGNYMAAAELISNWLIHSPHDIQQRVELGEIFYISDNHEQAERVWDEFIMQYGQNTSAYRMLIHTYSRLGLGEKMIQLVYDGRKIFTDPDFMALEMGHFYQSRQNVEKALAEYLVFAQHNPRQHKTILDKLLIISDDKEAVPIIENYLIKQIGTIPNIGHSFLAALYFKTGRYEESLQQQLQMNGDQQNHWKSLNTFAMNLRQEKQFDLAIHTYEILLQEIRGNPDKIEGKELGKVLLGLGQVYEDQIMPYQISNSLILNSVNNVFFSSGFYQANSISTASLEQAIVLYNTILNELEATSFSPKAHFRLGEIQFNVLQDLDGARQAYATALASNPDKKLAFKIHASFIDLLLAEGKIDEAQLYINQLPRNIIKGNESQLIIKSLKALLFNGEIDSSIIILDNYLVHLTPMDKHFNDFMELQATLHAHMTDGNETDKEALLHYFTGEKLITQHKLSEAVYIFANMRLHLPQSKITVTAAVREIFSRLQLGQTAELEQSLAWLISSSDGAKGLALSGEISEFINHDTLAALGFYEQLLHDHPESLLVEPVRKHIRKLKSEVES
ncbi:MAG TPA: tetratricopeptide repeat protein [Candidatus Marinimicrobia bacterium]|jgi:tetratricopeptide (TPR) repeat protein|nr:tetratricopeptide repeat protein [Candidatus Neomarinimicrobiota bacterium]MDP7217495.1 tetratricopeptide repeat protein [Candidatus Neomarinimicrobiota bacterium]HJL75239.1 tetratricopeptide repeat protein [Candidatus Neomarinimicrobiota bacterium]HJM69675.1 tetratricopeptide repeat protein [Candidatus Neomarinimicrobiota bacterium]|tara:strand:- start:7507 stop:9405 length:1899 start_codon:yes stop_codon:yes gene_type:complete